MVIVSFNDGNKLVSFFARPYRTVEDAKASMNADALVFAEVHGGKPKWRKPKSEDYLEVAGEDGCSCVWQYMDYGQRTSHGRC